MSSQFKETASETIYDGHIVHLRKATFLHDDGEEATREIVNHDGAVGIVVHDGTDLFLIRQPREAIGVGDLLEIPAGRLDKDGEDPVEAAKRELAEEIQLQAEHWEPLKSFYTSPGFTDEIIHLFLATGLSEKNIEYHEENERIDLVRWPLADLDALIDQLTDGKSLIALLEFRRRNG